MSKLRLAACGDCGIFLCEPCREWVKIHDVHKKAMEYLLSLKANS